MVSRLIQHWIAVPIFRSRENGPSPRLPRKLDYPDEKRRIAAPRVTRTSPRTDFATCLQKGKGRLVKDCMWLRTCSNRGKMRSLTRAAVSIFVLQSCLLLRSAALIESICTCSDTASLLQLISNIFLKMRI